MFGSELEGLYVKEGPHSVPLVIGNETLASLIDKQARLRRYYVIARDFNRRKTVRYDIMAPLVKECKSLPREERPVTHEDYRNFVVKHCKYRYAYKCEYEVLIAAWPPEPDTFDSAMEMSTLNLSNAQTQEATTKLGVDVPFRLFAVPSAKFDQEGVRKTALDTADKIDIWQQIEMNLDAVAVILQENMYEY